MEEQSNQQPAANTDAGNKPETASLIDRADSVAKRMEEANRKAEELLSRQESLMARQMLAGRSEAGSVTKTPQQTEQEKVEAEAKKMLKQFGINK